MKKALKTALIILIVLLIIGTAIGGYFIWRHHALYIGADAALGAALVGRRRGARGGDI